MTFWIGTSWKMNKTRAEARAWVETVAGAAPPFGIGRFVMPPATCLAEVSARLAGTDVQVGAQNMHWDDAGPWTGEVSGPQIADCGAKWVELGHSERRAHFAETDATVGLKCVAALRHGLVPLVCIGERMDERDAADAVLGGQVRAALAGVTPGARMMFAYEPVWAIGETGIPATPAWVAARHAAIGATVRQVLGHDLPVLYGGSVSARNAAALAQVPGVAGLFIGRAAWEASGYLQIVEQVAAARGETP